MRFGGGMARRIMSIVLYGLVGAAAGDVLIDDGLVEPVGGRRGK
jgi:hypothetical protein